MDDLGQVIYPVSSHTYRQGCEVNEMARVSCLANIKCSEKVNVSSSPYCIVRLWETEIPFQLKGPFIHAICNRPGQCSGYDKTLQLQSVANTPPPAPGLYRERLSCWLGCTERWRPARTYCCWEGNWEPLLWRTIRQYLV